MELNQRSFESAYEYLSLRQDLSDEQKNYVYFLKMLLDNNDKSLDLDEDFLVGLNEVVSAFVVSTNVPSLLEYLVNNSEYINKCVVTMLTSSRVSVSDEVEEVLKDDLKLRIPNLVPGMPIKSFRRKLNKAWHPDVFFSNEGNVPYVMTHVNKLFEKLEAKFGKYSDYKDLDEVRTFFDEIICDLLKMGELVFDGQLCDYFENKTYDVRNLSIRSAYDNGEGATPAKEEASYEEKTTSAKTQNEGSTRSYTDINYDEFERETFEFDRDVTTGHLYRKFCVISNVNNITVIESVSESKLKVTGSFSADSVAGSDLFLIGSPSEIDTVNNSQILVSKFGAKFHNLSVKEFNGSYLVTLPNDSKLYFDCDSSERSVLQFTNSFDMRSDSCKKTAIKFIGPKFKDFKIKIGSFVDSVIQESKSSPHNYEDWDLYYTNSNIDIGSIENSELCVPPGSVLRIGKVDSKSRILIQGKVGKIDVYFGDSNEPIVLKGSDVLEGVELGYYTK